MKQDTNDTMIYFPDLLADILEKWKQLAVCMLAFGVLMLGLTLFNNFSIRPITSGQVSSAKEKLTYEQYTAVDTLHTAEKTAKAENDKVMAKWNDNQKAYYNMLIGYENNDSLEKKQSPVKKTVGGILLGLIIALCKIVLQYVFSSSVKTVREISAKNIPVIGTFTVGQGKKNLFYKIISRIRVDQSGDLDARASLVSADIEITAKENKYNSLYFVLTSDDEEERKIANKIASGVRGIKIVTGRPDADSEELRKLADMKNAVLFAVIDKTKKNTVTEYLNYTERFKANIIGAVVIRHQ